MLIRQDFKPDLPPINYLLQVTDSVTKVYCYLWKARDEENKCKLTWSELTRQFHKNSFRTSVRKLVDEGLVNCKDNDMGVEIELVDWKNDI